MPDICQPDEIHPELGNTSVQKYGLKHAPVQAAPNAESTGDCVQQASEIESVTADSKIADPYDATASLIEGTKDIQSQRGAIDDEDEDGDEDDDGSGSNSDSDEDLPRFDTDAPRGRITKPVAGPKPPRPKPKQPYEITSP